jgi:hypothetical protein
MVAMTEQEFWDLIDSLHASVNDDSVEALTAALVAAGPEQIVAFENVLAEKLHALDTPDHMRQDVRDAPSHPKYPLSTDMFLYFRCDVIVRGRAEYEAVLSDPNRFAGIRNSRAQHLLAVAEAAWERATDTEWTHETPLSYESMSNQDAWDAYPPEGTSAYDAMYGDEGAWDPDHPVTVSATIDVETSDLNAREIPVTNYEIDPGLLGMMSAGTPFRTAIQHAQDRLTEVLLRHGGFSPHQPPLLVTMTLEQGRGAPVHVPESFGWRIALDELSSWSDEQAQRVITGLAAYHAAYELRENGMADHPAIDELLPLADAAADLAPALRDRRA